MPGPACELPSTVAVRVGDEVSIGFLDGADHRCNYFECDHASAGLPELEESLVPPSFDVYQVHGEVRLFCISTTTAEGRDPPRRTLAIFDSVLVGPALVYTETETLGEVSCRGVWRGNLRVEP
ncbi:MAG: hypothetical protein AAGH15_02265 [Myxococcota bacterium]